ncbi:hypothetical protein EIQ19_06720 [Xanthomonas campestris pv. campestris]
MAEEHRSRLSFMAATCVELFAVALGLSLCFRCSPLVSFALKRAEHRSHAWPKRRPCLSVASLGAVPRVARSTGHRCGFIAPDRVGRARFW